MIVKKFEQEKDIQNAIEEIFWLTSSGKKSDEIFYKYMGIYLEKKKPIFYALDEINSKVLGYILGDTIWDESYHALFPFYEEARLQLLDYPAHLHINCHPEAQGMGVGSKLLAYYENYLRSLDIKGLHLVTAEEADNVKFYRKNNYLKVYKANWKQNKLVFLGKTLEA